MSSYSDYANAVSQLYQQQAQGQIAALQARTQASIGKAQNIGQTIGNLGSLIADIPAQQQARRQQQMQERYQGLQMQNLQSEVDQRTLQQQKLAAIHDLLQQSNGDVRDPAFQAGLGRIDADAAAGLQKTLAEADKAAVEAKQAVENGTMTRQKAIDNIVASTDLANPGAWMQTLHTIKGAFPDYNISKLGLTPNPAEIANATQRLRTQEQRDKAANPDPYSLSPGQTRFDPRTNQPVASVPVTPPTAQPFNLSPGQTRFDSLGNPIAHLPPTPPVQPATPFGAIPASGTAPLPPGQRNEDFLKTLPAGIQPLVQALSDGKMQFPSGAALRSEYWQGLLQAVGQYDPSFDAVNYNARSKTRADFTSGASAKQVNAINTVIGHLDNLSDAADALGNGNVQTYNRVKNYFSREFGSSTVTNFETIKKAVADEITRVWRQSGGTEADIQSTLQNLSTSGSSEQLHGAIATFGHLLESKLGSLNDQYRQGMGTDKIDILSPTSRSTLDKLEKRAGGAPAPASATAGSAPSVGSVMLWNGKRVRVVKINPNGTADLEEVP